ncbi:hypothetical protein CEUSTIGMA_g12718.t1 [Chlamydomonas eustigma]|uniref:Uncharacterized protein n=1 Tax=Chlamydomonas eustigma TaxID=1157962 RepID=A0A250XQE8_9CHLO|nr:hypothetical protein CEUSTIGMA_g12718.t1 [Chlamydomonas eustigma]|eukprot:GAX85301.1 hypothetical protein CEUSTIGMA_g12718.t1 [Chlamydomonas eustigma]
MIRTYWNTKYSMYNAVALGETHAFRRFGCIRGAMCHNMRSVKKGLFLRSFLAAAASTDCKPSLHYQAPTTSPAFTRHSLQVQPSLPGTHCKPSLHQAPTASPAFTTRHPRHPLQVKPSPGTHCKSSLHYQAPTASPAFTRHPRHPLQMLLIQPRNNDCSPEIFPYHFKFPGLPSGHLLKIPPLHCWSPHLMK